MRRITAEVHALGVAGFPGGSQPSRVGSACRARRCCGLLRSRGRTRRGGLAGVTGPGGSGIAHCDQFGDKFRHRLDLQAVHCHRSFASRASRPAFDVRSTLRACPRDARLGGPCDVGSADASFQWNPGVLRSFGAERLGTCDAQQAGGAGRDFRSKKLRFQPGTKWEYSNSNYLLLGVVIEHISGQPLEAFLRERIFDPLQLRMVADLGQEIPGRARSYRQPGSAFENVNWHLYALGPAGIWSTSADLVRWADNYRTGSVGGPALLTRVFDGALETGLESSRYGAGIRYGAGMFIMADNTLVNNGDFEGFRSQFIVSPDRQSAVAVLCNRAESKPDILTEGLAFIWGFR